MKLTTEQRFALILSDHLEALILYAVDVGKADEVISLLENSVEQLSHPSTYDCLCETHKESTDTAIAEIMSTIQSLEGMKSVH